MGRIGQLCFNCYEYIMQVMTMPWILFCVYEFYWLKDKKPKLKVFAHYLIWFACYNMVNTRSSDHCKSSKNKVWCIIKFRIWVKSWIEKCTYISDCLKYFLSHSFFCFLNNSMYNFKFEIFNVYSAFCTLLILTNWL